MPPSEWAERHRVIPRGKSSEPGKWRNARAPYLAGIMDAAVEPGVEEVVVVKGAQVGFSEAMRNVLGYWIAQDPGPCMLVMPTEQSAQQAIDERIRPMVQWTRPLADLAPRTREDDRLDLIRFGTMEVYTGWSRSPQALASRPLRYIMFDEVDKYPPFSGKEADPYSLGLKRLATYGHRARSIAGSTPTTRMGPIWQLWERSTRRFHYEVPCPDCGKYQRLEWGRVHYADARPGESRTQHADRVKRLGLAVYKCRHCEAEWHHESLSRLLPKGRWTPEEGGGSMRRVGFHLPSLYSRMVSWSALAAEWIEAQGYPSLLMDFVNSRLGEPFEEQVDKVAEEGFREKMKGAGPPRVVPDWTDAVIATADVQKGHVHFLIRAWGRGLVSRLLDRGTVTTWRELEDRVFKGLPEPLVTEQGEQVVPAVLGIDSRYRTDEVRAFAQQHPGRVVPLMGSAQANSQPMREQAIRGYYGVVQVTLNTHSWKDVLSGLIRDENPDRWQLFHGLSEDYAMQMSSERKIHDPKLNVHRWEVTSKGRANHDWDMEAYQVAMAHRIGVAALPVFDEAEKPEAWSSKRSGREPQRAVESRHVEHQPQPASGFGWGRRAY